mgnify:CR=1 FL=1
MLAHTILLVFGLYFMACGAGLLANPDRMARLIDELEDSPAIGFLCGAVMIFAAGGTLSVQNSFSTATDGIATLPDDDHLRGFGIVALALGLVVFAIGAF